MTERAILEYVVEYVVNCAWQIPLLATGAWLITKMVRPRLLMQHCLWLSVLATAILLPLRRVDNWPFAQKGMVTTAALRTGALMPATTHMAPSYFLVAATSEQHNQRHNYKNAPLPMRKRSLVLSPAATQSLVGLYLLATLIGVLRLLHGLMATRRLARFSREAMLEPRTVRTLEEACRRLHVDMPRIRESREIDGPVIVCAFKPVMVLPYAFEEHADEEVRAALLHELAHVRRRDYLINLICQIAALPVFWHPAVFWIQIRIRSTREMLCDAIAAKEMNSGAVYAECLLSLARSMLREANFASCAQTVGLFQKNTMEERLMKLTETKVALSGRTKALHGLCGCAAMLTVMVVAATFHVSPTFASAETLVQTPAANPTPIEHPKPSAQVSDPSDEPIAIARGSHAKVQAEKGDYLHHWKSSNGEPFTMVNRDPNEPSTEERRRVERQFATSKNDADEVVRWANGPEFQADMAELQNNLSSAALKLQMEAANKITNDPALKLRMDAMQQELSHLDTLPELKKFNDPEWQKQIAELQMKAPDFKFNLDLNKQMAIANSAMNEAELNETIANAMKGHDKQMTKLQKEIENGELQQKLDEATRLLEEVKNKMETLQAK